MAGRPAILLSNLQRATKAHQVTDNTQQPSCLEKGSVGAWGLTFMASVYVEFQQLIRDRLRSSPELMALLSPGDVHDRIPSKAKKKFPYISFGSSTIIDDDEYCRTGGNELMQISIWSRENGGFKQVKTIAAVVKRLLHEYEPINMGHNALDSLRVNSLRFLRDPDGLTSQCAIELEAFYEEVA